MNLGVLFMGDTIPASSSHHHHRRHHLADKQFFQNEIEIENENREKEKKKKGQMSLFPTEEITSNSSSNNSSRKSSVNHSSASSNNSIDTKTRNNKRLALRNILLGPVDVPRQPSKQYGGFHHPLPLNSASVDDPIFYYIQSSQNCPCPYHDQLRKIDDERALANHAKSHKHDRAKPIKGSFYVSSNSSSTSSSDYETPIRLKDELLRLHQTKFQPNQMTDVAIIHHWQQSPTVGQRKTLGDLDDDYLDVNIKKRITAPESFNNVAIITEDHQSDRSSEEYESHFNGSVPVHGEDILEATRHHFPEVAYHPRGQPINSRISYPSIIIEEDVSRQESVGLHSPHGSNKSDPMSRRSSSHDESLRSPQEKISSINIIHNNHHQSSESNVLVLEIKNVETSVPHTAKVPAIKIAVPVMEHSTSSSQLGSATSSRKNSIASSGYLLDANSGNEPIISSDQESLSEHSSPVSGRSSLSSTKKKVSKVKIIDDGGELVQLPNRENQVDYYDYEKISVLPVSEISIVKIDYKPTTTTDDDDDPHLHNSNSEGNLSDSSASSSTSSRAVIISNGCDNSEDANFGVNHIHGHSYKFDPSGNWTLRPAAPLREVNLDQDQLSDEQLSHEDDDCYTSISASVMPDLLTLGKSSGPLTQTSSSTFPRTRPCMCLTNQNPISTISSSRPSAINYLQWNERSGLPNHLHHNSLPQRPRHFHSSEEDIITVCPPRSDEINMNIVDPHIRHFFDNQPTQLPLCIQNIILQHVQNAETFPEKSNEEASMKKRMSKFFFVPDDPSDPVAFTETFPELKRKSGKSGWCGSKSVHKIVGFFTVLMTTGIIVTILCVYHFSDTFRPMM